MLKIKTLIYASLVLNFPFTSHGMIKEKQEFPVVLEQGQSLKSLFTEYKMRNKEILPVEVKEKYTKDISKIISKLKDDFRFIVSNPEDEIVYWGWRFEKMLIGKNLKTLLSDACLTSDPCGLASKIFHPGLSDIEVLENTSVETLILSLVSAAVSLKEYFETKCGKTLYTPFQVEWFNKNYNILNNFLSNLTAGDIKIKDIFEEKFCKKIDSHSILNQCSDLKRNCNIIDNGHLGKRIVINDDHKKNYDLNTYDDFNSKGNRDNQFLNEINLQEFVQSTIPFENLSLTKLLVSHFSRFLEKHPEEKINFIQDGGAYIPQYELSREKFLNDYCQFLRGQFSRHLHKSDIVFPLDSAMIIKESLHQEFVHLVFDEILKKILSHPEMGHFFTFWENLTLEQSLENCFKFALPSTSLASSILYSFTSIKTPPKEFTFTLWDLANHLCRSADVLYQESVEKDEFPETFLNNYFSLRQVFRKYYDSTSTPK